MLLNGRSVPPGVSVRPQDYKLTLLMQAPVCVYCNTNLTYGTATLDHVVPLSQGGQNATSNVLLACQFCNQAKRDRSIEQWIRDLTSVWSRWYNNGYVENSDAT